jgi:hypothetical protein
MARQDRNADRRQDTYGGERENEFGGEPEALEPEHRNTNAWHGERRRKFMEKFERWRRERAARAARHGPDSAPADSPTGRTARK